MEVDPSLKGNVSCFRVQGIKTAMELRFDPSLVSITVRPKNPQTFPGVMDTTGDEGYLVVQGIHTVLALQKLKEEGKIEKLRGMEDGLVHVNIVNVEEKDLVLYGNLRGNALASVFIQKPKPQDLLKIFGKLEDKKQALQLVKRLLKLQLVGPTEAAAVVKLCDWPSDCLQELLACLELFERYETKDIAELRRCKATVSSNQGMLMRGETLTLTNRMLVDLSKTNPGHFKEEGPRIASKEKSIRAVIYEDQEIKKEDKVVAIVEELTGKPLIDLQNENPVKYDCSRLKEFKGAELSSKGANYKGEMLRQYIEEENSGSSEIETNVLDGKSYPEIIETKSSTVLHLSTEQDTEARNILVGRLLESKGSCVILPSTEAEQIEVLCQFKMNNDEDFKVGQVFFEKKVLNKSDNKKDNAFEENLVFGVVKGKWNGSIKSYQGKLENLQNLVNIITEPGATIISITEPNLDIVELHSKDLSRSIKYFASPNQLKSIEEKMNKEKLDKQKDQTSDTVGAVEIASVELDSSSMDIPDSGGSTSGEDEDSEDTLRSDASRLPKSNKQGQDEDTEAGESPDLLQSSGRKNYKFLSCQKLRPYLTNFFSIV